jgi:predicted nucleic acid-binding protein
VLYLDASALAKHYIIEPGSSVTSAGMFEHGARLVTSVVTYAEVLAALARCLREERLTRPVYVQRQRAFITDWNSFDLIHVTTEVLFPAARLVERYRLRGFDAVHLCCALWAGTPAFACFDERLRAAAAGEGLEPVPTHIV